MFADKDVKDRKLSDWDGTAVRLSLPAGWLAGSGFQKRRRRTIKTFDEIKAYYRMGYATDVEAIGIENNVMEFHKGKGQPLSV